MTAQQLLAREGQPVQRRPVHHCHGGRHRSHTARTHGRIWALLTRDDDLASEIRTVLGYGLLVVVVLVCVVLQGPS